jgi:hypothetical protein
MGIRLDWEIEADQRQVKQDREDPLERRRRWLRRLRLALLPLVLLLIIGLVVLAIVWRLREVEAEIDQLLRASVEAEVAALRIGDEAAFLQAQRSATDDWQQIQRRTFDQYQELKVEREVQLTGRVLDTTIDGPRGRVQVEEIIDGVPYVRTWFYWRYDDGWRHVPPDLTFWGAATTRDGNYVTAAYQEVDAVLAASVVEQVDNWLANGCAALGCEPPAVTVIIEPNPGAAIDWLNAGDWVLRVPSPYTGLARADMPFDTNLQLQVADLLAAQLVERAAGELQPVYPADAHYLLASIRSWLVGQFVQLDTGANLVESLAQNYGNGIVGQLLRALQPASDIGILPELTGASSLATINADWRDFFTWRLVLENELIAAQNRDAMLALYDTSQSSVVDVATARYQAGVTAANPQVVSVIPEYEDDGALRLRAVVEAGSERYAVIFRQVDDNWLRAN